MSVVDIRVLRRACIVSHTQNNMTKTAYGVHFSLDFPMEEMDAIGDFNLIFGFRDAPQPLLPVAVDMETLQGDSVSITWEGYDVKAEDELIIMLLENVLFDRQRISFLGAYIAAHASSNLWFEATTPRYGSFDKKAANANFEPVYAKFVCTEFEIDLMKLMHVATIIL